MFNSNQICTVESDAQLPLSIALTNLRDGADERGGEAGTVLTLIVSRRASMARCQGHLVSATQCVTAESAAVHDVHSHVPSRAVRARDQGKSRGKNGDALLNLTCERSHLCYKRALGPRMACVPAPTRRIHVFPDFWR